MLENEPTVADIAPLGLRHAYASDGFRPALMIGHASS
jgi:hypothetical protein